MIDQSALQFAREHTGHLGKFEGEPEYVPYFYSLSMDGSGEAVYETCDCGDDDCMCELPIVYTEMDIDDDERSQWPELAGYRAIRITYSDVGFVGHELVEREVSNG